MERNAPVTATMLDANLLQLFELICITRSVTRAAEQLGPAQPTVSIWLSNLRKYLNDPLFLRTPSGMQPTPEAGMLNGTVRRALESLRTLAERDPQFEPATSDRRFRIGMTDASHIILSFNDSFDLFISIRPLGNTPHP